MKMERPNYYTFRSLRCDEAVENRNVRRGRVMKLIREQTAKTHPKK
jgi:hypothetical protein